MKEKAKKGKKAKVAVKDLDLGKVKGGVAEEDLKGGIIIDNRPGPDLAHKGSTIPTGLRQDGSVRFNKH